MQERNRCRNQFNGCQGLDWIGGKSVDTVCATDEAASHPPEPDCTTLGEGHPTLDEEGKQGCPCQG